jgi:hypothetical protein
MTFTRANSLFTSDMLLCYKTLQSTTYHQYNYLLMFLSDHQIIRKHIQTKIWSSPEFIITNYLFLYNINVKYFYAMTRPEDDRILVETCCRVIWHYNITELIKLHGHIINNATVVMSSVIRYGSFYFYPHSSATKQPKEMNEALSADTVRQYNVSGCIVACIM